MKTILILVLAIIFLGSCSKEPDVYCFECHNRTMQQVYFISTVAEMEAVQAWWANPCRNDTLYCKIIK